MDLECVICFGSLTEELDVKLKHGSRKHPRQTALSVAGPSSGPSSPELCITKCGHMFHKNCLVNWIRIGYSQSCPTCRKALTEGQLVTVYLPVVNEVPKKCNGCEATKKTCDQLAIEKDRFKKLYEKEVKRRKGAELDGKKSVEERNERLQQLYNEAVGITRKLLEEERKTGRLTAEKGQLKKLLDEELERGKGVQMEVKKIEWRLQEEQRKVGVLEQKVILERNKVEEIQGTFYELQVHLHRLLFDVEEMRRKYEVEQQKGNNLKGRVASLEVQLERERRTQRQNSRSIVETRTNELPFSILDSVRTWALNYFGRR